MRQPPCAHPAIVCMQGASDSAIDELSSLEHQLALSQRQADQANAELARTRLKLRLQAQAMPQGHSAPPMALLPEKPIEEQQLVVMDRQASVGTGGDAVLAHSGVSEDTQAQLDILTRMVHDLKIKLAEATQAKVDALIKLAAAGECAQPSRPQAGNLNVLLPSLAFRQTATNRWTVIVRRGFWQCWALDGAHPRHTVEHQLLDACRCGAARTTDRCIGTGTMVCSAAGRGTANSVAPVLAGRGY